MTSQLNWTNHYGVLHAEGVGGFNYLLRAGGFQGLWELSILTPTAIGTTSFWDNDGTPRAVAEYFNNAILSAISEALRNDPVRKQLVSAFEELLAEQIIEERHHLELHSTRDAQEAFFEKYRETDPANYRMFREARAVHHEALLGVRRRREQIIKEALAALNKEGSGV